MRKVELTGGRALTQADLNRSGALPREVMDAAEDIVRDVRDRGDAAVREYCTRFDGACPESFRVPDELVKAAPSMVDPEFLESLTRARDQILAFHQKEREESWFTTRPDGTLLGVQVTPVASAAVYVPGGRAQYPSTVLMDTIPAKVAGVPRVVMVTPPQRDGSLSAYTLAAAALAGVDEVYAVGGAQAIGAVAYGTESIPACDKIVGPGNAYVAAAKRYVSGDVGIDMVAGPSEVCVLADATADPVVVAADLMAQAEHDPLAACYLVTFDAAYADEVERMVERHLKSSTRAEITAASLADQGLIVVCDSMPQAIEAVNAIAPEHLELHVDHAFDLLGAIRNAGAIFLGAWTPEAVGDYAAGPNHTLPTGGTARYASPLSVDEFVKKSSVIQYSSQALARDADMVTTIARHEGLWAHAMSVEMRKNLLDTGNVYGIEGGDGAGRAAGDGGADA